MIKRKISDILDLIAQFQASHDGDFPTTRSPSLRRGDSWNAIDGALRRDAIVQCEHFVQLKAALQERGLTPTLARLAPAYRALRSGRRVFSDIVQMARQSSEQHGGRFPIRTDRFDVRGHDDTWLAIDSALAEGAIADCPLWSAHRDKMALLGVTPSLASLNPRYRPVKRQPRSIASIMAAILLHMKKNAGAMPTQRSRFPDAARPDSWKAICKALRSGAIAPDADRSEFHARLELSLQKPSLFTLIDAYRSQLQGAHALASSQAIELAPVPDPAPASRRVEKKPVQFAALLTQLFYAPPAAGSQRDAASSHRRLARNLAHAKW